MKILCHSCVFQYHSYFPENHLALLHRVDKTGQYATNLPPTVSVGEVEQEAAGDGPEAAGPLGCVGQHGL